MTRIWIYVAIAIGAVVAGGGYYYVLQQEHTVQVPVQQPSVVVIEKEKKADDEELARKRTAGIGSYRESANKPGAFPFDHSATKGEAGSKK